MKSYQFYFVSLCFLFSCENVHKPIDFTGEYFFPVHKQIIVKDSVFDSERLVAVRVKSSGDSLFAVLNDTSFVKNSVMGLISKKTPVSLPLSVSGTSEDTLFLHFSDKGNHFPIFIHPSSSTIGVDKGLINPSSPELYSAFSGNYGDYRLFRLSSDQSFSAPLSNGQPARLSLPDYGQRRISF